MIAFHDILFPLDIALKSAGGPERRTEIVSFSSGREERNARLGAFTPPLRCRLRHQDADGTAERGGVLRGAAGTTAGFRSRDRLDQTSNISGEAISLRDQGIGIGDGATASFQLMKTYGSSFAPYQRPITKPVDGSVRIAVAGDEISSSAFSCDVTTGLVTFASGHIPAAGAAITAGFQFDVPVRFDTDLFEVDLSAFAAGAIPKIPLLEIRT
jgi:uncharacterized protein (TIGR02217 family)